MTFFVNVENYGTARHATHDSIMRRRKYSVYMPVTKARMQTHTHTHTYAHIPIIINTYCFIAD